MAEHVIAFNPLDPLSVFLAEREYRRLLRDFDRKVDEFLAELAELGREEAEMGFGGTPVTVSVEAIDNGYSVIASGEKVAIIEFGAGDTTDGSDPFAAQSSYEIRPGSYSETHAREYSQYGQWTFGGVVYTAIQPRNAMEWAWNEVHDRWREIAERVFA